MRTPAPSGGDFECKRQVYSNSLLRYSWREKRESFELESSNAWADEQSKEVRPMHSRLATCIAFVVGCALLAIPAQPPAQGNQNQLRIAAFGPEQTSSTL